MVKTQSFLFISRKIQILGSIIIKKKGLNIYI